METQVHRGMRTLLSLMAATALSVALARPASSSEAQAPNASAPATSRNAPASSAGAAKRPAGSRPSAGLSLAPWDGKGNFIAYYQDVTGAGEAPLITLDAAAWMLLRLREEALSATELFALAPRLKEGVEALAVQVRKLAPPPALAPAHKRLLAYLGVAQALLDPKAAPPAGVEKEVSEELARIEAHKGFEFSAVLDQKMDYSQMAPRGKYARNEELARYFKALMYLSRALFRVGETHPEMAGEPIDHPPLVGGWWQDSDMAKAAEGDAGALRAADKRFPTQGREETQAAALLALCADQAGADGKKPREIFEEIESRLRLLFGPGDDLGLDDLYKGLGLVYKNTLCLDSLADGAKLLQLAAVLRQKANPMVDSTGMGRRGFSLLGQRPVFDACVLQMLIAGDEWPAKYRTHVMTTPENLGPFTLARDDARGPLRGFPRGLDVFAAAGNPLARETLQAWGDDAYEGYPERLVAARNLWTERLTPTDSAPLPLYDDVLGVANGVVEAKAPPGAPDWMRSTEYQRLRLNSGLAVWAGLRHEAILYAKQSYTGILRALPPGRPEAGYVEPRPLLYGQMAEAAARVAKSLDGVAGGASQVAKNAAAVQRLMERLKTISDGLLAGRPLSDDDEKWISGFHLAMSEALRLEPDLAEQIGFDLSDPVSVVADVHTRAPLCVEEGVGDLWEMRVEVGHDETMRTVRGPIFAYYEFKQPMESRLTDEAWRALLASDNAPKPLLLKASEK